MKSVTILLLTIFLFSCGGHDLTDQEEDIPLEKLDQPSHVIPDSLRVPGVDSIALGVYVDDTSTIQKQAAAAVAYMTSTQVDAKIATVAASIKTAYTAANTAQDTKITNLTTANAKLTTDLAAAKTTITALQAVNVTQAKTNTTTATDLAGVKTSISSLLSQIAALPKSSQDSVLKLIQDLQASSASYFYRLEDQNNRLYQLKYNDSVKNIGLNYVTGKAWDTERRLNAYTSKTDSLMVSVDLSQFTVVGDRLVITKWQTLVDALKKFGINL